MFAMPGLYVQFAVLMHILIWNAHSYQPNLGSGSSSGDNVQFSNVGNSGAAGAGTYPNKACWMPTKDVPFHYMGKQGFEVKYDVYAARKCFADGHCSKNVWRFFMKKHRLQIHRDAQLLYYPPGTMTWVKKQAVGTKEALIIAPNKLFCRFKNVRGNVVIGTKDKGTTGTCTAKVHNKTVNSGPQYELLTFNGCGNNVRVDNATAKACPSFQNTCSAGSAPTTTTTTVTPETEGGHGESHGHSEGENHEIVEEEIDELNDE